MAGADVDLKFTVTDVLELGDAVIADGTMVVTIGGKEVDNGKYVYLLVTHLIGCSRLLL